MQPGPPVPSSVAQPSFTLRPLTTGEVLDRSFSLFRSCFLLCIGIAFVPALLSVVQLAVRLVYLHVAHLSGLTGAWATPSLVVISTIFSFAGIVTLSWSSAAICWAVSRRYQGRAATMREAYRLVLQHWFRYPALLVLQLLQSAWFTILLYAVGLGLAFYARRHASVVTQVYAGIAILLAFLSIFLATFLYIRLSLSFPAAIMENLPATAALRRSKALLQNRKGRVFAVLVLIGALYMVLGAVVGVLGLFFLRGHLHLLVLQGVGLLANFVSTLLLQPLLMIALCIVYFDERVRRDGYDLTFMMEQADLSTDLPGPAMRTGSIDPVLP